MGIQINGQTDTISATDGSFTISGASGNLTGDLTGNVTGDLTGNVTGNVTGNLTGTASTATAAATAYGISGTPTLSGITSVSTSNLTVNGTAYPSAGPLSNRNLIINGAMQVAQRGTQETGVTSAGYKLGPDRYRLSVSSIGTWTVDQSTDAPDGFSNSYKLTCTTANASPTGTSNVYIQQRMEAQSLQNLKYGTASAESVTVSFWVKSNKTGTYTFELYQEDGDDQYSQAYSISSADTWEYKTLTFSGNTAAAIVNDNGRGLEPTWWLAGGPDWSSGTFNNTGWASRVNANRLSPSQVNLGDATSNYWAVTGVQLEVGSVATPFEHRSYGDELARCQRYYIKNVASVWHSDVNGSSTSSNLRASVYFPVQMRTSPSTITTTIAYTAGNTSTTLTVQYARPTMFTTYPGQDESSGLVLLGTYTADAEL